MHHDYVDYILPDDKFATQYFTYKTTTLYFCDIICVRYCSPFGRLHNIYYGATTINDNIGESSIVYYECGRMHRCNGPSYISYNRNTSIKTTMHKHHGKLHNMFGPAVANYMASGELVYSEDHVGGFLIRINGKFGKI